MQFQLFALGPGVGASLVTPLDEAAGLSISASRRIFLALNCAERSVET